MPVVRATQQLPTIVSSSDRTLSPKLRVPLRALQMLTQSVSPLTRDYVQPFPISEGSEQKKSPLALLAATCSSIGKTESKQETREQPAMIASRHSPAKNTSRDSTTINDGRSSSNKISTDETKSSFKPYKHVDEPKESHHNTNSPEKPGFRALSKDTLDSLSHGHRKSPEFRSKASHMPGTFTPFQYPYLTDSANAHCFYQTQNRMCGMYLDIGYQPSSAHHSCLKTDCPGNCGSGASTLGLPPTSLPPTNPSTPSIRPIFPSASVSSTSTVKSHGLPSSAGASRSNPLYPRCNCGYCNQASSHEGNLKGVQHPGFTQYHRDYLQASTNCQDPYCTNCKSQVNLAGNSPRGCGPHCFHHHHENPTVLPGAISSLSPTAMSPHLYPYGFMLRPQSTDQVNPFVCNWVQDSKNCGKNFPTSDELLQHLRTHTSSANTTAATPLHTPCNIPGCPCNLKALSGSSRLHSARYHPYFIPSPGALHSSSSFHSSITPYAGPHGIPYGSPFKPY